MSDQTRKWIHPGLIMALGILISASPLMAQRGAPAGASGGNGQAAPRGNNDGSNAPRGRGSDQSDARKQIQQAQKAAIEKANEKLKTDIAFANLEAQSSSDATSKTLVKNAIESAQREHKIAVDKARATAKAALAALNSH